MHGQSDGVVLTLIIGLCQITHSCMLYYNIEIRHVYRCYHQFWLYFTEFEMKETRFTSDHEEEFEDASC